MKRGIVVLIFCGIYLFSYSQNEIDIKNGIVYSLNDFFSQLSMINDDEEPIRPSTIAAGFKGEHYFRFNGKDISFENFLKDYSHSVLQNSYVNHTLDITKSSIKKTTSTETDKRYTVKAKLKRQNATDEDYYIKDEDITLIVKWNGIDKDVSILDVSFSAPLQIIRPIIEREYKFELDSENSILSVPYYGGNWKIALKSWFRDVKSYPGIPDKTTEGDWYLSTFEGYSQDNLKFEKSENPQFLSGTLRSNYSKDARYYNFKLTQNSSGKSFNQRITHERRVTHWYDFDSDIFHQLELFYSLKYNFGISYMYTFDNSRLSLGALIAMNFDNFRGMESIGGLANSSYSSVVISIGGTGDGVTNGYKVTTETVNPEKTNYSELMDPYNEAKHYTSRSLYLAQGGFNISQWMRFDLGLGAARAKNLYFMENAYALDIYKYEKTYSTLPDIDDVYVYRNRYKDYYYEDPAKWGFAIRPALNFQIPLGSYNDSYLSLGLGYTFVTGIKDASSLDFSIGIRWE